jgi:hypothetical protein
VPGSAHRFLVQELILVAQRWGYEVLSADVRYHLLSGTTFHIPPKVLRHRPDLIAARKTPPFLLIGEAKTASDLASGRSREQIADFASIPGAMVLIAVPKGSEQQVTQLLQELCIRSRGNVRCIAVPEVLFPDVG